MSLDYGALWALVLANTLLILLVIRHLAATPHITRLTGPQPGLEVGEWSLESLDGTTRRSADLPRTYTLLFMSHGCKPCQALMAELRQIGPPQGALYVVYQEAAQILNEEEPSGKQPYDLLLVDGGRGLYTKLGVPGTPYAVAVHDGRVNLARLAPTVEQLAKVVEAVPRAGGFQPTRS